MIDLSTTRRIQFCNYMYTERNKNRIGWTDSGLSFVPGTGNFALLLDVVYVYDATKRTLDNVVEDPYFISLDR
jgi:hypothetical protein